VNKIIIIILLSINISKSISQDISHDLLSNGTGESVNGNIKLSWSVGELMVSDKNNGLKRVTEGFYQKDIRISALTDSKLLLENKVKVYPNPASDKLYISYEHNANTSWSVSLYDINAGLIIKEEFTQNATLDIRDISKGIYMIRINNHISNDEINYKVEKL
jgi:hypothetical protein